MRARIEAPPRRLDKFDPTDHRSAVCREPIGSVGVEAVYGQEPPESPHPPACLSPATRPGKPGSQIVVEFWRYPDGAGSP